MKQVLLILGPILIFAILITGGLQITDPQKVGPVSTFVSDLVDQGGGPENTLQIKILGHGISTPAPTPGYSQGTYTPGYSQGTYAPIYTQGAYTPASTPPPALCEGKKVAFNLLIDTSGSLSTHVAQLRDSLASMANHMGSDTVVGAQQFNIAPGTLVTMGRFNKSSFVSTVRSIQISGRDETYMYKGFEYSQNILNQARSQYPGYRWKFIFISDGIPNDNSHPGNGPDESQNPIRQGNIPGTIKNSGIELYALGLGIDNLITTSIEWVTPPGGAGIRSYASNLMSQIASPGKFLNATDDPTFRTIFDNLIRQSCQ